MRKIIVVAHMSLDGSISVAFEVTESEVSPNSVIIVNYERTSSLSP